MRNWVNGWKSIVSFSPEIDISSHLIMIVMRVIMIMIVRRVIMIMIVRRVIMINMNYLMRRSLMLSTRVAAMDAIWKLRNMMQG